MRAVKGKRGKNEKERNEREEEAQRSGYECLLFSPKFLSLELSPAHIYDQRERSLGPCKPHPQRIMTIFKVLGKRRPFESLQVRR